MASDVETVVIGAGVVGLAVALELARSGHEVLLLERWERTGAETSSRSSEVIHAGLYYAPGSLKARLCSRGRDLLYAFARDNGVAHRRCGKLLVATAKSELPALEAIAARARDNGVTDLVWLDRGAAREREPALDCLAAYHSPSTGIIDSHALMLAMEGNAVAKGASIALSTTVVSLSRNPAREFVVGCESQGSATRVTARNVVAAAGLGATSLGRMIDGYAPRYRVPDTFAAKGHYFALSTPAPFHHLVYPMPYAGSLGIHLTLDMAGRAKFGPDIEWCEEGREPSYAFDDADGARMRRFEQEIRRYWPALPDAAIAPAYTGLRPKLTRAGEPAADFAIHSSTDHGIARFVALYGIESPGLTSSLAIAEEVARRLA